MESEAALIRQAADLVPAQAGDFRRDQPRMDELVHWQLTREQAEDRFWQPIAWTRDGHFILAVRSHISRTDSSVYRIEAGTGKAEELTPHSGRTRYFAGSILNSSS